MGKGNYLKGLELELPCTWLPSWSTWLPKSWNLPVMLLGTIRSEDNPSPPSASHQERRGAEQAACWGHHSPGGSLAQHTGRAVAEEESGWSQGVSGVLCRKPLIIFVSIFENLYF